MYGYLQMSVVALINSSLNVTQTKRSNFHDSAASPSSTFFAMVLNNKCTKSCDNSGEEQIQSCALQTHSSPDVISKHTPNEQQDVRFYHLC